MATRHARRSVDGDVDERREARREEQPAAPTRAEAALQLQRMHGNQAVQRMLARSGRVLARGYDPEFTFGGAGIEMAKVDSQDSCNDAVETEVEEELAGHEALFMRNETASSPSDWADLVFGLMEERYDLVGIGQPQVLTSIRWLKDKFREESLLRLARVHVYETDMGAPYTAGNLLDRLIAAGLFLEAAESGAGRLTGRDAATLEAIFETEAAFARTKVKFNAAKNIELLDEDNIVVLIDHHQQKHQTSQIPHFPAYTGKPGSKFADGKNLAWHETTTALVVKETVRTAVADGTMTPETEALSPSKDAIGGIIYDLTITFDDATGKYVGGYHCNPVVNEGS